MRELKDVVKIAVGIVVGFGCIGAICLGLLLTGAITCGLTAPSPEEVIEEAEKELFPTPTPFIAEQAEFLPLGQSIVVENVEVSVSKYEVTDSLASQYEWEAQPEDGAKFLWLYVSSKNVGQVEEYLPSAGAFELLYKGTEIMPHSWPGGMLEDREQYEWASVYPDYGREGWILYEVPLGADPSEITVRMTHTLDFWEHEYWFWRLQ